MRITSDLIQRATVFINPLGNKEIDLRSSKIQVIENLGVTEDNFDTIDLSDNEIVIFENFPLLKNLKTIFFNNNNISKLKKGYGQTLPNLDTLIFTNNNISDLGELCSLNEFTNLTMLSFAQNPVVTKQHYRLFVIHIIPSLKVLDFNKVKHKERLQAKKMFGGKEGEKLFEEICSKKSTEVIKVDKKESTKETEMKKRISLVIERAKTIEDVQRLTKLLQSGNLTEEILLEFERDSDQK